MSFGDAVFWIFAAMAVLPAVGILFSRSVVRMAFLLLFSLAGFAGLYLHLEAAFVGFTQVLVYIGGILVLFLFGVMLTAKSDFPVRGRRPVSLLLPEALAGILVSASLLYLAVRGPWVAAGGNPTADGLAQPTSADQLGMKLLSTYVLPFEAVTVLLLAAMVGATYIARGEGTLRGNGAARGGETTGGGPDGGDAREGEARR
jgi:NADH-quinone oxidoreductase subunit J